MKRKLLTMLVLLTAMVGMWAQTDDEGRQILVFRNTGEVNLFYSNDLDSITMNDTAQVFHSVDTILVVPFAELDSVAVGSRNELKFHSGVKELTEDDLPWIISFDGESIYYRPETPMNVLPSVGMKLFYRLKEKETEEAVFPCGLCAKVTNVTKQADKIRVDVENIPLNEVFEKLFLAGPISSVQPLSLPSMQNGRRAPVNREISLDGSLRLGDIGNIGVNGFLKIDGNAVIHLNPFKTYCHADLDLTYGFGADITFNARENVSHHYEEMTPNVTLATFYGLLQLGAATGVFADVSAEMNLNIGMERTFRRKLLWTRENDKNTFEFREDKSVGPYEDKAKIDMTLSGYLFFGPVVNIGFSIAGDLFGARAKVFAGPKIDGKINLGLIQQMRNYNSEFYGSAKLDVCTQIDVKGYVTHRRFLLAGKVDEHEVYDRSFTFGGHKWNLFPEYERGRAVASKDQKEKAEITVATAVPEPTPTPLETGFEIVGPEEEIVDSIFVGIIQSDQEEVVEEQIFDSVFAMPQGVTTENLDGYYVRPVFHYAGHTISAAPIHINKDLNLQFITGSRSNGSDTFLGGAPFLGSAVKDSTLYSLGLYLPVPPKKRLSELPLPPIVIGKEISESHQENLIGTWSGKLGGYVVTITFGEEEKGVFTSDEKNASPFDYELNIPQTGEVLITFEDDTDLVLLLRFIDESTLEIIDKRDKNRTVNQFKKQ